MKLPVSPLEIIRNRFFPRSFYGVFAGDYEFDPVLTSPYEPLDLKARSTRFIYDTSNY
jgi:hypothetical protein